MVMHQSAEYLSCIPFTDRETSRGSLLVFTFSWRLKVLDIQPCVRIDGGLAAENKSQVKNSHGGMQHAATDSYWSVPIVRPCQSRTHSDAAEAKLTKANCLTVACVGHWH